MRSFIFAFLALFLAACASGGLIQPTVSQTGDGPRLDLIKGIPRITDIPKRIVGALMDPITEFAVADSQTTIKWVDEAVAAGKITAAQATEAKACPLAVIAINDLYTNLTKPSDPQSGETKGLIYFATVNKYSSPGGIQEQGKKLALDLVSKCGQLIPANRFAPISGAFGG